MESQSAKYGLIGAIVAALIAGGVTLFIHFDKSPNGSKLVDSVVSEEKEKQREPTVTTRIIGTFISPVAFDRPAYFYTEIKSAGEKSVKDALVSIDFGRAAATECEIKPKSILVSGEDNKGLLRFKVSLLNRNESIYIACDLTLPTFNKILVSGGNLTSESVLTFDVYAREPDTEDTPVFLIFMFIFVGLPFSVYLMIVVMRLINRWLKMSW